MTQMRCGTRLGSSTSSHPLAAPRWVLCWWRRAWAARTAASEGGRHQATAVCCAAPAGLRFAHATVLQLYMLLCCACRPACVMLPAMRMLIRARNPTLCLPCRRRARFASSPSRWPTCTARAASTTTARWVMNVAFVAGLGFRGMHSLSQRCSCKANHGLRCCGAAAARLQQPVMTPRSRAAAPTAAAALRAPQCNCCGAPLPRAAPDKSAA